MSIIERISEIFNLSTPVMDEELKVNLEDKEYREKLLSAIRRERETFSGKVNDSAEVNEKDDIEKTTNKITVKRLGNFSR
jgi:hypothetical protein